MSRRPRPAPPPPLIDLAPGQRALLDDVLAGLSRRPKTLPSKYFYDERGSALFDAICDLPEYYLTRTELQIMTAHAAEMAEVLGPRVVLVELGSGSSVKTPLLLDPLHEPAAYVPVDISREHLSRTAADLDGRYPQLAVLPVCADFTQPFELPATPPRRCVAAYFPGSTIGNFEPGAARRLLAQIRALVGDDGWLLIGIDLAKAPDIINAAYNDSAGVTARFNLNLLARINRELGADFDLDGFCHRAVYLPQRQRVEMHLVAQRAQTVHVGGRRITFAAGESIHTENSYKYTRDGFARLAANAGFTPRREWRDARGWFAVVLLRAAHSPDDAGR